MANDPSSIVSASQPATLGDRLRRIADELRQETDTQIKATSRILGAAAQMAQNHDRLIDEVVDMVEEDLDHSQRRSQQHEASAPYEVANLKREFKTLKAATVHFGIKTNRWDALAAKLNEASGSVTPGGTGRPGTTPSKPSSEPSSELVKRLDAIDLKLMSLQESIEQMVELLQEMVKRP